MIIGITGLPGSGKTYYLAKKGLAEKKKGRDVFANFGLEGAIKFTDLNQVFKEEKGLVLVDEINLLCPSRWWDKFPMKQAYYWSQSRKLGLDIYWSAQHIDRVDKIIREISNWVWELKSLPFGITVMNQYLPTEIKKKRKTSYGFKAFIKGPAVWDKYDTFEKIKPASRFS